MSSQFSSVVARLSDALRHPLPGPHAHAALMPRPRRAWPPDLDAAQIRHAAGLLLVVPVEDRAHILLTVRADTLARHGGQVSLPGGGVDPGETIEQAALREAEEEIGLDPSAVTLLGRLSTVDIPVSGFRLHPVLGYASPRPALRPARDEVARIVDASVDTLRTPAAVGVKRGVRDGRARDVPFYGVSDVEIWGATAMIVAEFLTLLGWAPPPGVSARETDAPDT